ncbi:MAG: hypothetical protein K8I03_02405 [Ignavibacteria bacterium]|nr:hypothetical protein [Ignavibacteria bacterium]
MDEVLSDFFIYDAVLFVMLLGWKIRLDVHYAINVTLAGLHKKRGIYLM